jgi:MFS superfamily sulfate permease-like transporter
MLIALLSIGIMFTWDSKKMQHYKFFRMFPAPLFVVIFGVVLNMLFSKYVPYLIIEGKHMVNLPLLWEADDYSSFILFPDFSVWSNPKIYFAAITIAVVASLETLLSVEACDKLDPFRRLTPLNRELKAQGVANFISGLFGGLPLTSVIVRSSTNITSGARTKASAISHGIILLLMVLLFPKLLQMIPLASLAAILITVGYKLSNPFLFKSMFKKGLTQFLPFLITVVAVMFTNLLQGVFMGMLVAVFFILRTNFNEAIIMVSQGNNFLLKTTKDVSFLNKANLREKLQLIPPNSSVTIDGTHSNFIDDDIKETIDDFMKESMTKNINIELKKISI